MIVLAEATHDSIPWTDVPQHFFPGTAKAFNFAVICSGWMNPALAGFKLMFYAQRSRDGKVTWEGFGASDKNCGTLGKGATQAIQEANAKKMGVWWDGLEMDVRWRVDVTPSPFAWGLETL